MRRPNYFSGCWKVKRNSSGSRSVRKCFKISREIFPLFLYWLSTSTLSSLILYLIASHLVLGSVLIYEDEKKQRHVYFTIGTLQSTKEIYQVIEKLFLSIIFSIWRPKHYFRSVRNCVGWNTRGGWIGFQKLFQNYFIFSENASQFDKLDLYWLY